MPSVADNAAMSRLYRIVLLAASAVAGIVLLAASATAVVLRVTARSRMEAIASEALGMEVHIGGRLAVGFLPGLHVSLADVHVRNRGAEVAATAEVDLGIELVPLLSSELRTTRIGLRGLTITIERDANGTLNIEALGKPDGSPPTVTVTQVSVSDATLIYADKRSRRGFEAAGCNLDVSRVRLSSGDGLGLLKNLSLAAKLACGQIRTKDFTASDLRLSVEGQNGVFRVDPVTVQLFGGRGSGAVSADFSGSLPVYQIRGRLAQFRLEEFLRSPAPKSLGEGSMDFSTSLGLRGTTMAELLGSVGGTASLHSDDLRLAIGNLDETLSRYESSQTFNLVDVGAFFFAGPLGLAVTKGYNFARIFQGAAGTTTLRTLVSDWQVENGLAEAQDVAMATPHNRIALRGGLDFVSGQYDRVTVAVIDATGCATVQQRVHGPFMNPVVEKPNVMATLTGPTRTLLRKARSLLGGKCAAFYSGSVTPPK